MPATIILGTGHAVPEWVVTNDDLARQMDTSDEWIQARTGIRQRHWVREGESGVALGRQASLRALEAAGLAPDAIDLILYATSTPDHFCPGNGVFLQHALGLPGVPAIDLRTQCSGFVYALSMADAYIRSATFQRILVVGQEIQSTRMDVSTHGRHTAVIFADGAGAAVVGATDEPGRGLVAFDLHGDGAFAQKLWADGPGALHHPPISLAHQEEGRYWLQMDGREVYRHAIQRMPESVRAVLAKAGLTPGEVDLLIPHQANLRISEAVQESLGLPEGKVYNNIDRYGNTTAATIPIALDECVRAGRLTPGMVVVFTAFGSGFLWGSALLRW